MLKKRSFLLLAVVLCLTICLIFPASAVNVVVTQNPDGTVHIGPSGQPNMTTEQTYGNLMTNIRNIATAITGICVITAVLSLIFQISKLGAAGDNEKARRVAMRGILISGAVLAVFGSLGLVIGFFWNVLG